MEWEWIHFPHLLAFIRKNYDFPKKEARPLKNKAKSGSLKSVVIHKYPMLHIEGNSAADCACKMDIMSYLFSVINNKKSLH